MHLRHGLLLLAALGGSACGTNAPDVPKELLTGSSGCGAPEYPSENIGYEVGNVVKNRCFTGYRAPAQVPPAERNRETIAFSDYYDPAGTKGVTLLLINTAAVWCGACVAEHGTLPQHQTELAPQGLVILGTLFENAARDAASLSDLDRWIANFHSNFPMVADPHLYLEDYASADSAPLNMLVDPRSMQILRKYVGDQGTVMWPYIESELARRSAAH